MWDQMAATIHGSTTSPLLASVVLGAPEWTLPAIGLTLLTMFFLYRGYRDVLRTGQRSLFVAAGLKAIACLLCAALLVEPLWTGNRPKPGANLFLMLADNSLGMGIRDKNQDKTRAKQLHGLLADDQFPWRTRLQQDFQVRNYTFDQRLQRSDNFLEMQFDGLATSMGNALATATQRLVDRPVAGVLLFTDGNATDMGILEGLDKEALPPIYPVLIGSEEPLDDLGIGRVSITDSGFEDAPVTVDAEVETSGFAGNTIHAALCQLDGTTVSEHSHEVNEEGQKLKLQFRIKPQKAGISFYELKVSEKGKQQELKVGTSKREATLANNRQMIAVDRGEGPYRILYVAGRPNWEFKFLRRALEQDRQLDLVSLIRIARREAKFDFRGREGQDTNSLFRGFNTAENEEQERYDEPVLIRHNTKDERELRDGFPKLPEQLFGYHAIILDDLESEFFTQDQLKLLHDFVADRGGSLLMLGGQESFHNGKYERTPVGDVLPVYVDRLSKAGAGQGLKWTLTREGWLQPWIRLRDNETDERGRLAQMPAFNSVNAVRAIKPGASVLASVTNSAGENFPAVVVQRFGHGKSAAITVGDMWRWGIRQPDEQNDLAKAWRQIARWLVDEVGDRVAISVDNQDLTSGPAVKVSVRVSDEKFQPMDNSRVQLTIATPGEQKIELTAEPSKEQPGVYISDFVPKQPGGYELSVAVTDSEGAKQIGKAQTGWVSNPGAEEFRHLPANRALLADLAEKTGGQLLRPEELHEFTQSLSSRPVPVTEQWASPLWHRPLILIAIIGCLATEWGLRRYLGLA